MKVSPHSLPPATADATPKVEDLKPHKRGDNAAAPTADDSRGQAVTLDLSDEAKAVMRGKSAQSPAHQARARLAADPSLAGQPFGKLVSQIAKSKGIAATEPAPTTTPEPTTEELVAKDTVPSAV